MAILKRKQARIYKDIDLSFEANSITGDINKKLDVAAVKQSMKNLVMTNTYERPFNPDLSSELRALLFENVEITTANNIKTNLEFLFKNFEPRARIENIECNAQPDLNTYDVSILFTVIGINQPEELTVKLERLR
tara:strand:- start:401 stop:805 length:405 start_codon:yes stop_codon:yes gene_type:complete